jgi:hypothetical protein
MTSRTFFGRSGNLGEEVLMKLFSLVNLLKGSSHIFE